MGEASNPVEVRSKQWWTRQTLTKAEEGGASRERESEKEDSGARDEKRILRQGRKSEGKGKSRVKLIRGKQVK